MREDCIGIFEFARGMAGALRLSERSAATAINAAHKSQLPENDLCAWFDNQLRKFAGTVAIDDFHIAAAKDARTSKPLSGSSIDRPSA
ncbi:MAG: hypothetical protein DLM50_06400 [Candidatus Meridianibacter frigidus]|nr:MAG: hypothetical protein DLM50_06400 [Candidatus Eremiobacteraeota bacterium]